MQDGFLKLVKVLWNALGNVLWVLTTFFNDRRMEHTLRRLRMNQHARIYQKSPDIVARKIVDEMILVPTST